MSCQLYLISPPSIKLADFAKQLKSALAAGGVGAFQLRLKEAADDDILHAAEVLLPICHEHDVAFILNDRPDLVKQCGADGVHLGQEDLERLSSAHSPLAGESQSASYDAVGGERAATPPHDSANASSAPPQGRSSAIERVRSLLGPDAVIGATAHASTHLAMEAAEQGADYVAFGAFHPTTSKPQAKIDKWGTPAPDILSWWSAHTVIPCVAIGGMTPENCGPCVAARADFIAAITAVWDHEHGPAAAVRAFNTAIEEAVALRASA